MSFFNTNERIKLENIKKEIIYCKNEVDYINGFIDHIKENVIKKCKNLNSVKNMLATIDKNNLIHKIIIVISNMIKNLLQIKEKVNEYKSIFVLIEYVGQIVFTGILSFTGLD